LICAEINKKLPDNFNLIATLKAESKDRIEEIVNDFVGKEEIEEFVLLPTVGRQMMDGKELGS